MGNILRPMIVISAAAGLALGFATSALASGFDLPVQARSNVAVHAVRVAQRQESKENRKQEREQERGQHVSSGSGSSSSTHEDGENSAKEHAPFGQLVSAIRSGFNDLRHSLQQTLQAQHAKIAQLTPSAQTALYAKIDTLIHDAFVKLGTDISAAITAAVGS